MARRPGEKFFIFYNPPVVNRFLGIRRSYINEASRVAQEFLKRNLQTIVFANSRLHTEVLLTYLQQANPAAARAAAADSRLSRRLSARRTPRDRARPARRPHSRRGLDQRAGAGHRRRLARCRRHGRLRRARSPPPGSARAAPDAAAAAPAPCWWLPRRRSTNSSCSIRIIFSAARPSTPSSSRTISKFS